MTLSWKISNTNQNGYLPEAPTTSQERRAILFFSGVWLVFFAWTVIGLLESTAPVPIQLAAWIALAVFPVIYLRGFLHPDILPRHSRHVSTLIYTASLILLGLVTAQATPTAIINIVPYLMAQWIFNHRLVTGIVAVVVLFVAAVGVVTVAGFDDYANWFLAAVGSPAIIMIIIRISIEMSATQQERSEQLRLAQQREELAATVHDVLGHSLTTITVKVQLAQRLLATDVNAARTELGDIEALARRSLSEVRATVTDLQHPDLTEQLDRAHNALTAAELSFHRPETLPRLTLVQRQTFAWVIREAVTNVIRHAKATTCSIEICAVNEQMRLRIDDDGVSITDTDPKNHHGLAGLHRRVVSAGGSLEIMHLEPGTRLEVIL